jgi:hypothetical protein
LANASTIQILILIVLLKETIVCTIYFGQPGAGATGSKKRLDAAKAVKNLNFPLAFWPIRAIIVRQSFPRPLDGVADIEGCDGHIH